MKFNPNLHHRRSIRLPGYDYTQPGAYFVTICTHLRQSLFGDILEGVMSLNRCGQIVHHAWDDLPNHYPHVILDAFCIMPNHIHGVIILSDDQDKTRPQIKRHGLPEIVRALKSFSARRINEFLDSPGVPVWQRNYYEHIIRNEAGLNAIRRYIINNPRQWAADRNNPDRRGRG